MKKKGIIFLAVISFAAFSNAAQAEEKTFSGEVKSGLYSSYDSSITGVTFYEHPVMQQSLTLTHNPSGVYASVWNSYSPNGREDCGDEIDYSIGICREVGKFKIEVSYSLYNLTKLSSLKGDLHALSLSVGFPEVGGFTPFVSIEKDLPIDKEILPGGFLYKVGGTFEVGGVNCKIYGSGHDGAYGSNRETVSIVRFDACKEIGIIDNLKAVPAVGLQIPVQADVDMKLIGSINVVYSF